MVNDILSIAPGDEPTGHGPPNTPRPVGANRSPAAVDVGASESDEGAETGSEVAPPRSVAEGGRTIHQVAVSGDFFTASKSKPKAKPKKKRLRRGR